MAQGTGLSIIEQYAARKQRARESWSWHMLFAMGPFCMFIWGPRRLAIVAWVAFAVILMLGVRRQFQIKRCPACNAGRQGFSIPFFRYRPDPYRCDRCGVELSPDGDFL
jgi:hypothetical protein